MGPISSGIMEAPPNCRGKRQSPSNRPEIEQPGNDRDQLVAILANGMLFCFRTRILFSLFRVHPVCDTGSNSPPG